MLQRASLGSKDRRRASSSPLDLAKSEVEVEPSKGVSDPNSGGRKVSRDPECDRPNVGDHAGEVQSGGSSARWSRHGPHESATNPKGRVARARRAPRRRNAACAGDCEGCGATTAGAREPTPALRKRRRSTERCRHTSRCSSCRRPQGQQSVIGNHAATPSCDRRRQKAHRRGAALPVEDREIRPCGHDAEGHAA